MLTATLTLLLDLQEAMIYKKKEINKPTKGLQNKIIILAKKVVLTINLRLKYKLISNRNRHQIINTTNQIKIIQKLLLIKLLSNSNKTQNKHQPLNKHKTKMLMY